MKKNKAPAKYVQVDGWQCRLDNEDREDATTFMDLEEAIEITTEQVTQSTRVNNTVHIYELKAIITNKPEKVKPARVERV